MKGGGIGIHRANLAEGRVGLVLLRLSSPVMIGMIIYSFFSLIDAFYIAQLGARELAALTMTVPARILVTSLASATGIGITSVLGRTLGSGNRQQANNAAWHGLIMGMVYGLLFLLISAAFIDKILLLLGCTAETITLSKDYLTIVLGGSLFSFILIILGNILQGEGRTSLPMIIALAGIILNVLFDPLLIFGWRFIPPLGIKGAAWATVVSDFICSFALLAAIRALPSSIEWKWRHFKPSISIALDINRIGIPTLIMELCTVFLIAWFNRRLAVFGYSAVAAYSLLARIKGFFQTPAHGLLQGVMPLTAFAYGAGRMDRVKETIAKSVLLAVILLSVAVLILQAFPQQIIGYFSADSDLTKSGVAGLCLGTLFMPFMSLVWIFHTVLQALGRGVAAMCFSMSRQLFIFIPVIYGFSARWGITGLWLGISAAELLSGLFALVWGIQIWHGLQKRKKIPWGTWIKGGYIWKRTSAWLKF